MKCDVSSEGTARGEAMSPSVKKNATSRSAMFWGVRAKIRFGFGFMLLLLVGFGMFTYLQVRAVHRASDEASSAIEPWRLANALRADTYLRLSALRGYLLQGSGELLTEYQNATQDCDDELDKLEAIVDSQEEKATLSKIKEHMAIYTKIMEREIELRKAGKTKEAETLAFSQEAADARDGVLSWLDELRTYEGRLAQGSIAEENDLISRVQLLVKILVLIGVLSGAAIAVLISRATVNPIQSMLELIGHVAKNDLTVPDL